MYCLLLLLWFWYDCWAGRFCRTLYRLFCWIFLATLLWMSFCYLASLVNRLRFGWIADWKEVCQDEWMCACLDDFLYEWPFVWMNSCMTELLYGWILVSMNSCTYEFLYGWFCMNASCTNVNLDCDSVLLITGSSHASVYELELNESAVHECESCLNISVRWMNWIVFWNRIDNN